MNTESRSDAESEPQSEPEREPTLGVTLETEGEADATAAALPAPKARLKRLLPLWAFPIATAVIGGAIGAGIVGAVAVSAPETVTVTETVTVDPDEEDHFDLLAREGAVVQQELEAAEREAELEARESALQEWENELSGVEAEIAANSITDGIWTVGVDVEPGTYRAESVSPDCYWATLESGSNGSDIIDNAIPGGGNPSVTLEEGWDFETYQCGVWVKQ